MAGYADCLAGLITQLRLDRPHVAGLSFGGALALELCRRHPVAARTLILVSAYAGWGGSLPAEVGEQRLRQAISLTDLSPDEFVAALLPTMFAEGVPQVTIEAFAESMRAFHPVGFRAMARAVPTLVVGGSDDVRAPVPVAEHRPSGTVSCRSRSPRSPLTLAGPGVERIILDVSCSTG